MKTSLVKLFGRSRCFVSKEKIAIYSKNIYGVKRNITAVVFPKNEAEIRKLISLANANKVPLYALSTGKNFGLGSVLPIKHRHVVVDLSKMNKILNFDSKNGYIRIQPGVTQFQVYLFLKNLNSRFRLNVTGSAKDSSLIGNALERGVAHYGSRVSEVTGLEAILGNGVPVVTGGNAIVNSKSKMLSPHGIGPNLTGLFFQSAFGIVTAATFRLQPVPESTQVVSIIPKPETSLRVFIEKLISLRQEKIIPENLHISNRNRKLSIVAALLARQNDISIAQALERVRSRVNSKWVATASFTGPGEIVRCQYRILTKSISNIADVRIEKPYDTKKDDLSKSLHGISQNPYGVPSNDSIPSIGFAQNEVIKTNLNSSNSGTFFLVPIFPGSGKDIEKGLQIVTTEFSKSNFKSFITLNLIEDTCFEAVINLTFDREDRRQRQKALQTIRTTFRKLSDQGYPPHRMSIFQMDITQSIDTGHLKTIQNLKSVFDPNGVISKGRYDLRGKK